MWIFVKIGETTTTYKRFVVLCEKIADYLKKKDDATSESTKLNQKLLFEFKLLILILIYNLLRIE